jgi:pilus assembly protein TadC
VIEAQFRADAHVSADKEHMRQNDADLALELRKAEIDRDISIARARAEKAGQIESEEQQKMVATKQAEQQAARALVMVKVAEHEAMEKLKASEGQVKVAMQRAEQDVVEAEGFLFIYFIFFCGFVLFFLVWGGRWWFGVRSCTSSFSFFHYICFL